MIYTPLFQAYQAIINCSVRALLKSPADRGIKWDKVFNIKPPDLREILEWPPDRRQGFLRFGIAALLTAAQ